MNYIYSSKFKTLKLLIYLLLNDTAKSLIKTI